jgi:hypothetical protein
MTDRATVHPMRRLLSNRRGLLAGAAALVGAGLAKLGGPGRADAAHGTGISDETLIHLGQVNSTDGPTWLQADTTIGPTLGITNAGPLASLDRAAIEGSTGLAIDGVSAVRGFALGGSGRTFGLYGKNESATTDASGIKGVASAGATNGVWGQNTSTAANAAGVYGQATGTGTVNVGVWGRSESSNAGAIGTLGQVTAPNAPGTGVLGQSASGAGVLGVSTTGSGVVASSLNQYAMY